MSAVFVILLLCIANVLLGFILGMVVERNRATWSWRPRIPFGRKPPVAPRAFHPDGRGGFH